MKSPILTPMARMIAIGLALLAAVVWLQQQHLAVAAHEHALIILVFVGFVAFWMAQSPRK
jgi:hypothetical protein